MVCLRSPPLQNMQNLKIFLGACSHAPLPSSRRPWSNVRCQTSDVKRCTSGTPPPWLSATSMKRSKECTPPPSNPAKRPRRPSSVHWSDGLVYAMEDPEQVFEEDHLTVTLKDGFPKARYHYLIVPKENLSSVSELCPKHLPLLRHIQHQAEDLISRIHKKEPGLQFRFGYHAVPSMRRLHLHIVSQDFDSPRMRTKHHWNTFNTDYFMDSPKVIERLESHGQMDLDEEHYEGLLQLPMKCNWCSETFEDITKLKSHRTQHKKKQKK